MKRKLKTEITISSNYSLIFVISCYCSYVGSNFIIYSSIMQSSVDGFMQFFFFYEMKKLIKKTFLGLTTCTMATTNLMLYTLLFCTLFIRYSSKAHKKTFFFSIQAFLIIYYFFKDWKLD